VKSADQLYRLDLYKQFLKESKDQVEKYDRAASSIIFDNQIADATLGTETSQEIISLFRVKFNKLSANKINSMIGLTKSDSPLYELLNKSYSKTVDRLVNTLITSQSLGKNPIEVARLMAKDMGGNKTRALLITRTECLRSNREAAKVSMVESNVCKGWVRIETIDASTCDECEAENGKEYSFDDEFDSHPNCRGCNAPLVG
jgi:SPP1 gp7 family putative phage head morphogenesis protein